MGDEQSYRDADTRPRESVRAARTVRVQAPLVPKCMRENTDAWHTWVVPRNPATPLFVRCIGVTCNGNNHVGSGCAVLQRSVCGLC